MERLVVGVTIGDPAGIGPEVVLKAMQKAEQMSQWCLPVVIGHKKIIEFYLHQLGSEVKVKQVTNRSELARERGIIKVIEPEAIKPPEQIVPGKLSSQCALVAFDYIKFAVDLVKQGTIDSLTTAPINKRGLQVARIPYTGHTTMLAALTGCKKYAMLLVGGGLRVALATLHIPLGQVLKEINRPRLDEVIELANKFMAYFDIYRPRMAVCALNPHAGEEGTIGLEEIEVISPTIKDAQRKGIKVEGPFPADTVFYRMLRGDFDLIIAMYHDQGLIPIKTLAFEKGVNVTMGLPFIRTSVDHGTAFDIAGKGEASAGSMLEAIKLAASLARTKKLRGL